MYVVCFRLVKRVCLHVHRILEDTSPQASQQLGFCQGLFVVQNSASWANLRVKTTQWRATTIARPHLCLPLFSPANITPSLTNTPLQQPHNPSPHACALDSFCFSHCTHFLSTLSLHFLPFCATLSQNPPYPHHTGLQHQPV